MQYNFMHESASLGAPQKHGAISGFFFPPSVLRYVTFVCVAHASIFNRCTLSSGTVNLAYSIFIVSLAIFKILHLLISSLIGDLIKMILIRNKLYVCLEISWFTSQLLIRQPTYCVCTTFCCFLLVSLPTNG